VTAEKLAGALSHSIIVLAAVKTVLGRFNFLFALWCNSDPMVNGCIPVQIAVLNYLAYL